MSYRVLPTHLHGVADEVRRFFNDHWGILEKRILVETAIDPLAAMATTLHAESKDHHLVCVEVAESAYSGTLDAFVLDCKNRVIPVRLFVAYPEGINPASFRSDLGRARRNGVGILEVSAGSVQIIAEAVSLSLSGLREPAIKSYPTKYRAAVAEGVATFKGGNPVKACGVIFDELEALTRRIGDRAVRKGAWRALPAGVSAPKIKMATAPWANIARELFNHLDPIKLGRPQLVEALLARVIGVTSHRNDSGHKPADTKRVQRRDQELRTRFEAACDLLLEFARASRM